MAAAKKPARSARPRPGSTTTKGAGASDAAIAENTGKRLAQWFRVLDRFGAAERGHTAAARHLREEHGVGGWYAQSITVAYERARGLRVENQAGDGSFQVSVSRVVPASLPRVIEAVQRKRERSRWLREADPALVAALEQALAARGGLAQKDDSAARLRFRWGTSTVELHLAARPDGRASVVASTTGLASKAAVESRRSGWKTALDALRAHLSA